MTETKWSNLETASPLCRHMLDETIEAEESGNGVGFIQAWSLAQATGVTDDRRKFGDMIRTAYAKLYEPDAQCIHTRQDGKG